MKRSCLTSSQEDNKGGGPPLFPPGEDRQQSHDHQEAAHPTATNVDLREPLEEGGFREDLHCRLNVAPLNIPPSCNAQ